LTKERLAAEKQLIPFLKWAGGKRWLVGGHAELFPNEYDTYIEPFLGAGSVYFHLKPEKAVLGDVNSELIATYQAIKSDWRALQNSLRYRQRRHREDGDYYYWLRGKNPEELTQRASRLIYLNRTCFNGIYRVNRQGQFNVPRGSKDKVVIETDDFEGMSSLLERAELVAGDFETLIDRAAADDFVFADPPYTVRHNYNGFVKYNEILFSWDDQERLAKALLRAAQRGAKIMCTNANHKSVRELYSLPEFSLQVASRLSTISADAANRKHFEELIIRANM
jgi:DNA adenine methylase